MGFYALRERRETVVPRARRHAEPVPWAAFMEAGHTCRAPTRATLQRADAAALQPDIADRPRA